MNRIIMIMTLALTLSITSYAQEVRLSLEDCQTMATQNNPDVKNTYLDYLAAQARKKEVILEAAPRVSLNAMGVLSGNPFIEYIIGDDFSSIAQEFEIGICNKGFNFAITAVQPLYLGGRIYAGRKLTQLGIDAANLKHKVELRNSREEVEKAYWEVVALEEKRKTISHLDSLITVLEKDVKSGMDAGVLTNSEMLLVQMKKNELKSGKIQLEGGLNLLKMNLFNSIGQDYSFIKAVADSTKPYIGDIYLSDRLEDLLPPDHYYMDESSMAAGVDETQLLGMLVESKKLEKRIALGEVLPTIGIGASGAYSHFSTGMGQYNVAAIAVLKIPITQWGKASQKLKRMEYDVQKAQNDKDFLESQLLLQIRQLWYNVTVAWEKMQVAKENVALAENTVSNQMIEYSAGLIPLKDLLMTQTTLFEASEGYINSQIEYSKALTAYMGRQ